MKIDESLKPFLHKHRIAVLSVLLDSGEPHGATLHYAWDETNGVFVFFTRTGTVKYQALEKGPKKASLVIGFSDEEFCTIQMRGEARICTNDAAKQAYCEKYRHILDFLRDSNAAFIEFQPTWYRCSDLRQNPATKISSEDSKSQLA